MDWDNLRHHACTEVRLLNQALAETLSKSWADRYARRICQEIAPSGENLSRGNNGPLLISMLCVSILALWTLLRSSTEMRAKKSGAKRDDEPSVPEPRRSGASCERSLGELYG